MNTEERNSIKDRLNGRPLRLLIGGSPCTYWSIAQKNNRETEAEGLGWELFKNYLIAKVKFKPDFFLYENNKSAAQAIKDQISDELGVELQYINSALVSAQNRQRFYAHNIPDVPQPEDRGILLKDILDSGAAWIEKSYALTTRCSGAIVSDTLTRHRHTMVAESVKIKPSIVGNINPSEKGMNGNVIRVDGKSTTLTTNKGEGLKIAKPVRIGDIGSTKQAHRVYSCYGKSVTINSGGGGQGGKTGLYVTPININLNDYDDVKFCENGNIEVDGKIIYKIENETIWYKGDAKHRIKLPDGYYLIRKLTPIECERLQTLPDNYTDGISNAQRYKCIGNGWTAEVIIHILSYIDLPKDYPIEVLSMYDGIATGRYCLEKLGYTNIIYKAYEVDKYAMHVALKNYPEIIECGDAFQLREDNWKY